MTTKNKIYTGLTAFAILGTGLFAGLAVTSNAQGFFHSEDTKSAIEANDLEAFKDAIVEDTNQRAKTRAENIDEEKFEQIRNRYQDKQLIQEAIDNNDYQAFKEAVENSETKGRGFIQEIDSEEGFQKLINHKNQIAEYETRLTEAVKNKDQESFEKVLKELKAFKENNKPENAPEKNFELTQEKLDNLYQKAVEIVEVKGEIRIKELFGKRKMMQGSFQGKMMKGGRNKSGGIMQDLQ